MTLLKDLKRLPWVDPLKSLQMGAPKEGWAVGGVKEIVSVGISQLYYLPDPPSSQSGPALLRSPHLYRESFRRLPCLCFWEGSLEIEIVTRDFPPLEWCCAIRPHDALYRL